jgi:PAS domain S-box-containing protein
MLDEMGPDAHALLDGLADAVVAADAGGRLVYANAAAGSLFAVEPGALVGRPLTDLMPERMRAGHLAGLARYLATGESRILGRTIVVPALRSDGSELEVELTLSEVRVGGPSGRQLFVAALRDTRGRVALERSLAQETESRVEAETRARELSALVDELDRQRDQAEAARRRLATQHGVVSALARHRALEPAMPEILAAIGENLGWDRALVWFVDEREQVLRHALTWHAPSAPPSSAAFAEANRRETFLRGEGTAGSVWANGRPYWSADIASDQRIERRALLAAEGLHGAFFFPIWSGAKVLGVLEFFHHDVRPPDEELLRTVVTLGGQIGEFVERMHAEQALRESEEWLAITLRSIGDAVIATDERARVQLMNPVAEALTAWTLEEARGRPLDEVFHILNEDTREARGSPTERVIRDGATVGLANHSVLIARDGREVPLDDSAAPIRDRDGRLIGVVLVFRDATAQRYDLARRRFMVQAGATLIATLDWETTLSTVVRLAVPRLADWCGVEIVDEDGRIRLLAVAHVDPAKVELARRIQERWPPDPDAQTGAPNVIRTGQPELYPEITDELLVAGTVDEEHLRAVREVGVRSAMVVPLRARGGQTLGAISFVSAQLGRRYDETDLAMATELAHYAAFAIDNSRLYREARAAVRARDDFLSMASHELKTPLTTLHLQVQAMRRRWGRGGESPEKAQRHLETLARQVDRLARLIDELLDISRITAGRIDIDWQQVDLTAVVREVVERFADEAAQARCGVKLLIDGPVVGEWDPLRIDQIATNLISNACKYGAGEPIEITVGSDGERARLVVVDRGIGIAPEDQSRIFDRFERAASGRHFGGFGLGLWIVRELLEALGGRIVVDSEPGRGSTFTVELPLRRKHPG